MLPRDRRTPDGHDPKFRRSVVNESSSWRVYIRRHITKSGEATITGQGHDDAAITVLGAITVRRHGRATLVASHPQRSILLALAAQVGRGVPRDDLVDCVWGPDAPPTGPNMIYRHIGGLRRLLEPGLPKHSEGRRIIRAGDGYRLMATPDTLDLMRFRDGVARARVLEAGHDDRAALDTFAAMLAMRTGPMRYGPGPAPVTAVRREYLAVFRDAVDLALRIERPGDLVHLVRHYAADLMADADLATRIEALRTACLARPVRVR
ncbi:AfsR/SARP family transcriptional regulator [Actinoplanes sichuanensis]|uniref:Helix-turn-helix domain-containing protein n=1 Tax=Actinoplanes sichuanensis TaxID=512349 RepID=A0ABW4A368_9ACTN|nr:helix-turn-helix domain-containing protein [Actinoplanes sichuanensis]